jgi:hypothetical protein
MAAAMRQAMMEVREMGNGYFGEVVADSPLMSQPQEWTLTW